MTIIYQVLKHILAGGGMGKPPISLSLQAYCLDGDDFRGDKSKDLRFIAGLGSCNCCDYFCPMGNHVMLIEEKQLFAKVNSIKASYGANVNEKILNKFIKQDLHLKVYGSLLVICRLKSQCATVNNMVKDKPYKFYLIVSDDDLDVIAMDGLHASLYSELKGDPNSELKDDPDSGLEGDLNREMGGNLKIVEEVIVCSPDEFEGKFPHLPPTNTNQTP